MSPDKLESQMLTVCRDKYSDYHASPADTCRELCDARMPCRIAPLFIFEVTANKQLENDERQGFYILGKQHFLQRFAEIDQRLLSTTIKMEMSNLFS